MLFLTSTAPLFKTLSTQLWKWTFHLRPLLSKFALFGYSGWYFSVVERKGAIFLFFLKERKKGLHVHFWNVQFLCSCSDCCQEICLTIFQGLQEWEMSFLAKVKLCPVNMPEAFRLQLVMAITASVQPKLARSNFLHPIWFRSFKGLDHIVQG